MFVVNDDDDDDDGGGGGGVAVVLCKIGDWWRSSNVIRWEELFAFDVEEVEEVDDVCVVKVVVGVVKTNDVDVDVDDGSDGGGGGGATGGGPSIFVDSFINETFEFFVGVELGVDAVERRYGSARR